MDVLDVTDREFWPPHIDDGVAVVREWLAAHGVDSADVYRVEVHPGRFPGNALVIRLFRYARDADGKRFVDPDSELADCDHSLRHCRCPLKVARLPPLDVAMRIPPPVPFRTVGPEG